MNEERKIRPKGENLKTPFLNWKGDSDGVVPLYFNQFVPRFPLRVRKSGSDCIWDILARGGGG